MQHFLKAAARTAGAQVIATELFLQFLLAVHDLPAALHLNLRREASATFAGPLKTDRSCRSSPYAWRTTFTEHSEERSTVSRVRIAPSKMLPSEQARAICDVTLTGPRAGGGLHDECSRAMGAVEGDPRALPVSATSEQGADPR